MQQLDLPTLAQTAILVVCTWRLARLIVKSLDNVSCQSKLLATYSCFQSFLVDAANYAFMQVKKWSLPDLT